MKVTSKPARDAGFSAYFETPRHALLSLLDGREPRRILEIGCGAGANLIALKQRFSACTTTGVEQHAQAADLARQHPLIDRLIEGDVLDERGVSFAPAAFDLIVLSHVLEHFASPQQVLQKCLGWLETEGSLLIALPNLRHATVLLDLVIRGDFRYQSCGILDETHLRFFTRTSALRFLRSQGLEIVAVQGEIQGKKSQALALLSLGMAREFAAFAYNILAVKK